MTQAVTLQPPEPSVIRQMVAEALAEDIGSGDLTAALIPTEKQTRAHVICRENAILCGRAWFDEVFRQIDPAIRVAWVLDDGAAIEPDATVCRLQGPAHSLLTGERTALNFLQLLSGTATETHRYVEAVRGHPARILDTRKTIPGLRLAQKYAVRCGGGHNHRMGLYDAILIKENHIATVGGIEAAVNKARDNGVPVEVEVENLQQLDQAITAGADRVLLDNFDLEGLRAAVERNNGRVALEASGGVDLAGIAATATTGVDYISIGALTKHVRAIDFSMLFI